MTIEKQIELMPKVELHVHLEGAVTPSTYFELAAKNNVALCCNNLTEWENYFQFKDFNHFINVYGLAVSAIKKAEDFSLLIEKFFQYQQNQNIVYSEAFLSASFIIQNFDNQEILDAIEFGINQGEKKYNTRVKLIPDISRHLPETQDQVLKFVIEGFNKGLFVGLGLGGMEINYPPKLFKETFRKAKEAGLKLVAHAGEAVGSESIWGALNDLKAERIGHGIRCLDDNDLIEYLLENQIPLEVAPTSNYRLGIVGKKENHPIKQMVDNGLLCTLNSDDPEMFSTILSDEYKLLYSQGFSMEELIKLNRNGIDSSFLDSKEKIRIHKILDSFINKQRV